MTSIDLSGFDTKNVSDMTYLFNDDSALTKINMDHFDTNKAMNNSDKIYSMFSDGGQGEGINNVSELILGSDTILDQGTDLLNPSDGYAYSWHLKSGNTVSSLEADLSKHHQAGTYVREMEFSDIYHDLDGFQAPTLETNEISLTTPPAGYSFVDKHDKMLGLA